MIFRLTKVGAELGCGDKSAGYVGNRHSPSWRRGHWAHETQKKSAKFVRCVGPAQGVGEAFVGWRELFQQLHLMLACLTIVIRSLAMQWKQTPEAPHRTESQCMMNEPAATHNMCGFP